MSVSLAASGLAIAATPVQAAFVGTVPVGIATHDLSTAGVTGQALAQQLVGTGVAIDNASVVVRGQSMQLGTFTAVDPSVVSFNSGVILSSGDIANIVGPNSSDGITGVGDGVGDADLTSLISATQTVNPVTYDAATLEFDFTPTSSPVYFTYTFGSDEYLEWVNLFNDVFGFFVTDGSGSTVNCAHTPSGDTISVDTINDTVNSPLFRDNSFTSPPVAPINVEADGLSVELICEANVSPGQVNHLKLSIADTSDQVLDSWVVVKAGSLSIAHPESCNNGVDDDDDGSVDLFGGSLGEPADSDCTSSTTLAPASSSGIGQGFTAPAFTGSAANEILLDGSVFSLNPSDIDPVEPPTTFQWSVAPINGTQGSCAVTPAGQQSLVEGALPTAVATCSMPGEYVAKLEAFLGADSKGDWDVDFFVNDAPPLVMLMSPISGSVFGVADAVSASVDFWGVTDGETVSCTVDWGNGAAPSTGVIESGVCSATQVYATEGQFIVSVTVTDSAGKGAAQASLITVSKQPQVISVTQAPPASAAFGTTFTVGASGGPSSAPVTISGTGACSHVGGLFTMTSGSGTCAITVSQAGDSAYTAAPEVALSVTAVRASQTAVSIPSRLKRGSRFTIPKTTAQGQPISVAATRNCTVTRNYRWVGSRKVIRSYSVTAKRKSSCYVTVLALSSTHYLDLQQARVRIRIT